MRFRTWQSTSLVLCGSNCKPLGGFRKCRIPGASPVISPPRKRTVHRPSGMSIPSTSWRRIGRMLPTDAACIYVVNRHFPDNQPS
jgi:hypothetical protein